MPSFNGKLGLPKSLARTLSRRARSHTSQPHDHHYLIQYLQHSDPPRDANLFELSDAAQEHYDITGSWATALG